MPSSDGPEFMVARFLNSNDYPETLHAFLREAGLPPTAAAAEPGCLTLEKVLQEKKHYEADLAYEKTPEKDARRGWDLPAPSRPRLIDNAVFKSNILHVYVPPLQPVWRGSVMTTEPQRLFVSSADRTISILSVDVDDPRLERQVDLNRIHQSPVLCIASITRQVFMISSMSGHVDSYRADEDRLSRTQCYHTKYAVQVIVTPSRVITRHGAPFCIAASAAWDREICLYSFEPPENTADSESEAQGYDLIPLMGRPKVKFPVGPMPESILFVRHPTTDELYMVVGCRDSTNLRYYKITEGTPVKESDGVDISTKEAGRQNLAAHANSWSSFSLSCLASSPTDPTLVAVATSHEPHMKLIFVRLLFPDFNAAADAADATDAATEEANIRGARYSGAVAARPSAQASQAMAELEVERGEEAAIVACVLTMAPQTSYSKPQVVWRPNGSGVWVNGDDGAIRGVEAGTGKVVAVLKGHEPGSKVRTLWAGMVRCWKGTGSERAEEEVEWLVSGGFDKKVIIWETGAISQEAKQ